MTIVNGERKDCAGMKLIDFLQEEGYNTKRIAVEVNEEIVPKGEYSSYVIGENDLIEVVSMVGGG